MIAAVSAVLGDTTPDITGWPSATTAADALREASTAYRKTLMADSA